MPQDKKDKKADESLNPLAIEILKRLGMYGPVRTAETVDVTAKNPEMAWTFQDEYWKRPSRGKLVEILLGSDKKPPTGVHMNEKMLPDIAAARYSQQLDSEHAAKYPKLAEAWQEMSKEHPYITRFVRNLIPHPEKSDYADAYMRWNMFWGGPDIGVATGLDNKDRIKENLAHELAHIGQQLNWDTFDKNKAANFANKNYMDRVGEQQSFDLGAEYAMGAGINAPFGTMDSRLPNIKRFFPKVKVEEPK